MIPSMPAFERVRREFMRRLDQTATTSSTTSQIIDYSVSESAIIGEDDEHGSSEFVRYFVGLGFGVAEIESVVESLGYTEGENEVSLTSLLRDMGTFLDTLVEMKARQFHIRSPRRDLHRVRSYNEVFSWPLIDMAEFGITPTFLHTIVHQRR